MSQPTRLNLLAPTEADLESNRNGHLSPEQRQILHTAGWSYRRNMLLTIAGLAGAFVCIGTASGLEWVLWLTLILAIPVIVFFLILTFALGSPPSEHVGQVTGVPKLSYRYAQNGDKVCIVRVGDQTFEVLDDLAIVIQPFYEYRFYFTTSDNIVLLLSLERQRWVGMSYSRT
jgi:hypothetical protein